jgi:oligopeptide transport system ATP-binding protein
VTPALEVVDLVKHFGPVRAVDGVSLTVGPNEVVGLVGESGSGKSTLGRCVTRLVPITAGTVRINGRDIGHLSRRALRPLRRDFNIVFQDPSSSLNPRMTVAEIVSEPLRLHGIGTPASRKNQVTLLLDQVGLNLIGRLQADLGFACLFITHDLASVEFLAQRVAVMYLGVLVEVADRTELFAAPRHPYSQALLSAAPIPDPLLQRQRQRIVLTGDIPSPVDPPSGCRFHTRCPVAVPECTTTVPPLRAVGPSRTLVACHLVGDDGTPPEMPGG